MADAAAGKTNICREGGKGIFLPLGAFGSEHSWPDGARGVVYGCALVYLFFGVAIASDTFMNAIDAITRRRKKVVDSSGRRLTKKVWNDTVATLSLMALGSSAPEIFLSMIDLAAKGFHLGDIGPSTIVGSAAFNLLVIVAVCISAVPSTEKRLIDNVVAFNITAAFSLFAYVWLAFILAMSSPGVVDIWEAVMTLLFLPLLVWVCYRMDCGDMQQYLPWALRGQLKEPEPEGKPTVTCSSFLRFSVENMVIQGTLDSQTVSITVRREDSTAVPADLGPASCSFRTESLNAVPGFDYEETEGTLSFDKGESEQTIYLRVLPMPPRKIMHELLVLLEEFHGDVGAHPSDDGAPDAAILTISILPAQLGTVPLISPNLSRDSEEGNEPAFASPKLRLKPQGSNVSSLMSSQSANRVMHAAERVVSIDGVRRANQAWLEQIVDVVYVNGSAQEQAEATCRDWVYHILALPWKFAFLVVPPVSFFGGWLCFFFSLGAIGALTAFVSDLAELFGCVLDVPDLITAISFVALGTSMPDLFASLVAAKEDPSADASIVNVTGSNSVNVFLGLGFPWTIAAVYWAINGRTPEWESRYPDMAAQIRGGGAVFVVLPQNIVFSVLLFVVACGGSIFLIRMRRKYLHCELGGPFVPKVAVSATFGVYWLAFGGTVSWKVMFADDQTLGLNVLAFLIPGVIVALLTCFSSFITYVYRQPPELGPSPPEVCSAPAEVDEPEGEQEPPFEAGAHLVVTAQTAAPETASPAVVQEAAIAEAVCSNKRRAKEEPEVEWVVPAVLGKPGVEELPAPPKGGCPDFPQQNSNWVAGSPMHRSVVTVVEEKGVRRTRHNVIYFL